jgi:hypothetical protein
VNLVADRLKSVALGVLLAVALLLLEQLATSVRDESARLFSQADLRWAILIRLVTGALLGYGVLTARRDWLIPAAAAVVLAVPVLVALGIAFLRPVGDVLPPAGSFPLAVGVGVLAFGAVSAGRTR